MKPEAIIDGHKYSNSGIYKTIPACTHEEYINYIESLPLNTAPEVFGLHNNAEIANNRRLTRNLL